MKASQKIALEMSEKREKLNGLLGVDELSDEQRTEMGTLTSRLQELETEARAAILAEGETTVTKTTAADGEGDELRSLIGRANIGSIFEATLEHRATSGAEAEIQAHFKVAANTIPLALLETRAVTPAPGQVTQNQAAIIPGVFPQSCAAFLAVDMPNCCRRRRGFSRAFDERRRRRTSRECSAIGNNRIVRGGRSLPRSPASEFLLLARGPRTV